MKVLIVYDSLYGNTEQIAIAIGEAITGEVKVLRVTEANPEEAGAFDLFIIGSPTQGGRPTPAIKEFLSNIPVNALKNVSVTSFDTRVKHVVATLFGYAAGRIAHSLVRKSGKLVAAPEGFIVMGVKGPLKEGELARAADWAKRILESNK